MSAGIPTLNPLAPLSTRILALSGFPPELKTRDIQAVFSQWEDELGGFKIKWLDDTNALVIFNDAAVAKRAYLHTLMYLPPSLLTSSGAPAKVRPYSGDDAESIISSVSNRARSRSMAQQAAHGAGNDDGRTSPNKSPATAAASPASGAATAAASATARTSAGARLGHRRNPSGSNPSSLPAKPVAAALFDAAQGGPSPARHLQNAAAAERAAATETVVEEDDDDRRETPDAAVKASA